MADNDRLLMLERSSTAGTPGSVSSRPKFHSPPVELPSSNAQNFFEEAKIYPPDEAELKKKFIKFATDKGEPQGFVLTLEDFCTLLQTYEICPPHQWESYFYAMDRNHDDLLDFNEFFLGCCAADPATVHILNSFTGYERAQYIFDFYDINRSATLEFNEFARLTAESLSLQSCNPNDENVRRQAIEKAKELGALEDAGHLLHFTCIKFKKFYEHIHTEKLRGTSRLFRFTKSIIKKRKDERGREEEKREREMHAWKLSQRKGVDDTTAFWNFLLDEFEGGEDELLTYPEPAQPPYNCVLPPAPAGSAQPRVGSITTEVQQIAITVLDTLLAGERINEYSESAISSFTMLNPTQIIQLCQAVIRILQAEPIVTVCDGPCKVFGSIHGQIWDLLSFFSAFGTPDMNMSNHGDLAYTNYIFLGDYGDRGKWSLEVIFLLFSLKYMYPNSIRLIRGHHENRNINYHLGLWQECEHRFSNSANATKVFDIINHTFEYLSLAAIVNQEILCIHSGINPHFTKIDQLKQFKKPVAIPHPAVPSTSSGLTERVQEQLLSELFPPSGFTNSNISEAELLHNTDQFCANNRISHIIRSRFVPRRGASLVSSGKLFTVTSCCSLISHNEAAMLHIIYEPPGISIKARRLTQRSFSSKTQKIFRVKSHLCGAEPRWSHFRDVSPSRFIDDPQALILNLVGRHEWVCAADDVGPCHALDATSLSKVRRSRRKTAESVEKDFPSGKDSKNSQRMAKKRETPDNSSGEHPLQKIPTSPSPSTSTMERNKKANARNSRTSSGPPDSPARSLPNPKSYIRPKTNSGTNLSSKKGAMMNFTSLDKEIKELGMLSALEMRDPTAIPFLWRLWQQAGWSEILWDLALNKFEKIFALKRFEKMGISLEPFSVWFIDVKMRIGESRSYFNAFDFDHDGLVSPSDFILGILVTKARGISGTLHALRSLAIMRKYMTEDDKQLPETPFLTEVQFLKIISDTKEASKSNITADECYPGMRFPMDHATFTSVAMRPELDVLFKLPPIDDWDI